MHSFYLLLVLSVTVVQARLTCLNWTLLSPLVGLVCHFAPDTYHAVANKSAAAIQTAVSDIEDVVKFDLTHNPVTVTFNYFQAEDPNAYLRDVANDYGAVTIGFGKEMANQAIQLIELSYWFDTAYCFMKKGVEHSTSESDAEGPVISGPQLADSVRKSCLNPHVSVTTLPKGFKITDPNQRVGSTIADIATLFIPVGEEVEAGEIIAGGYDLAISGSEDTTRIYKAIEGETGSRHFATEAEAQGVADSLKDPEWVKENCGTCEVPLPGGPRYKRSRRSRLHRRVTGLGYCCGVTGGPVVEGEPDTHVPDGLEEEAPNQLAPPNFDIENYGLIPETALTPAPEFVRLDISDSASVSALRNDLATLNTGVVAWPRQISQFWGSDAMLNEFRTIFNSPSDSPLYRALNIREFNGRLRLTSFSNDWIHVADPALRPFQRFARTSVMHGIDTVAALQGWTPELVDELMLNDRLDGSIEWFWTAPSEEARVGIDPRGLHQDAGLMQLIIADRPGLIIKNDLGAAGAGSFSRVPPVADSYYCVKARGWNQAAGLNSNLPNSATWHTVFGPEMAEEGRVSMVMTIYDPKRTY